MSCGSITAIGTSGHGARTTSPAWSCGSHCSALDMKPNERRKVHGRPEPVTACSESIMYLVTALPGSPPSTELLDTSTTCWTPAFLASASVADMPG